MIKIQIKSIYGSILFEYEKSGNTIKGTLLEALKSDADLRGADLRGADLRGADLTDADLRGADLTGADLTGAYLTGAYLTGAYLRGAYLTGAYLTDAYLTDAYLRGAEIKQIIYHFQIIPSEGSFIAWKKLANKCIAKIEIPAKSPRTSNLISRKCRAKFVKTLQIIDSKGNSIKEMYGQRDSKTIYKVGRLTYADKWDNDIRIDCSYGIHFFVTKQEAIEW